MFSIETWFTDVNVVYNLYWWRMIQLTAYRNDRILVKVHFNNWYLACSAVMGKVTFEVIPRLAGRQFICERCTGRQWQDINWALILWCQRDANYFKCGQCFDGNKCHRDERKLLSFNGKRHNRRNPTKWVEFRVGITLTVEINTFLIRP